MSKEVTKKILFGTIEKIVKTGLDREFDKLSELDKRELKLTIFKNEELTITHSPEDPTFLKEMFFYEYYCNFIKYLRFKNGDSSKKVDDYYIDFFKTELAPELQMCLDIPELMSAEFSPRDIKSYLDNQAKNIKSND